MELASIIEDCGGVLLFDGGMGSMIAKRGLASSAEVADLLVLSDPAAIVEIQAEYVQAGADVITTNTFSSNANRLAGEASVADVFAAAVDCARRAGARYVAADIGPLGALLEPYGDLPQDDAFELFAEQVRAAEAAQPDLIIIETMSDLNEAKLALSAAKQFSSLPVISSMTFSMGGFTSFGVTPEVAATELPALGASAVGMNCSTGPEDMLPLATRMLACAGDIPIMTQPNAGLPIPGPNGEAVYPMQPAEFADYIQQMLEAGVRIVGGCCGTDPSFIAAVRKVIDARR